MTDCLKFNIEYKSIILNINLLLLVGDAFFVFMMMSCSNIYAVTKVDVMKPAAVTRIHNAL